MIGMLNRNLIFKLTKIFITLSLIYYILLNIEISGFFEIFDSLNVIYLILAFFLILFGVFISSYKWGFLISIYDKHPSLFKLIRSYFIGMFFNSFLPSTIGGDIYRAKDISKKIGGTFGDNVLPIIFERLLGIIALVLISIISIIWSYDRYYSLNIVLFILIFTFILVSIIIIFYSGIYKRIYFLIPIKLKPKIDYYNKSLELYKKTPNILIKALFLSLLFQFIVVLYNFLISRALNLNIDFIYLMLVIPLISLFLMIPITINGIGLRETSFIFFMTKIGLSNTEAVFFSLLSFLIVTFINLLGGVIYIYSIYEK